MASTLFGPDNLTPDWDNIPEGFNFVAIDEDGEEFMFYDKPIIGAFVWFGAGAVTGRIFYMEVIDWKETLSERPKK